VGLFNQVFPCLVDYVMKFMICSFGW